MVVVVWLICAALSLPPLLGWSTYEYHKGTLHCSPKWNNGCGYYFFVLIIAVGLPSCVTVYAYTSIFLEIRKHRIKMSQYNKKNTLSSPAEENSNSKSNSSPKHDDYEETRISDSEIEENESSNYVHSSISDKSGISSQFTQHSVIDSEETQRSRKDEVQGTNTIEKDSKAAMSQDAMQDSVSLASENQYSSTFCKPAASYNTFHDRVDRTYSVLSTDSLVSTHSYDTEPVDDRERSETKLSLCSIPENPESNESNVDLSASNINQFGKIDFGQPSTDMTQVDDSKISKLEKNGSKLGTILSTSFQKMSNSSDTNNEKMSQGKKKSSAGKHMGWIQKKSTKRRIKRSEKLVKEFKIAKTGAILLALIIVCYGPYPLVHTCHHLYHIPQWAQHFAMWLVFSNSIISPIIYGFTNQDIRKDIRRMRNQLVTKCSSSK